jgi:hypothetical protein
MQGTLGRSYSELCFALNNTADGSLRLALRVEIIEIKRFSFILAERYVLCLYHLYKKQLLVIPTKSH